MTQVAAGEKGGGKEAKRRSRMRMARHFSGVSAEVGVVDREASSCAAATRTRI